VRKIGFNKPATINSFYYNIRISLFITLPLLL